MIYSFDIFDTCLARLCGEPHNLYDVLSKKVIKLMRGESSEYLRELFVGARGRASGNSLEEVYSCVAKSFPLPCSIQEMTTLEMETEKEMLVPILATRDLIEKFRASGRILFISDMYLPSSFLRDILTEKGFFKDGDSLYVSDELQAWKRDGALFKLIREREGISYREWHHYGDNYGSDYRIPKKLGIHAHYLHYDYLPYEERWRNICATQYQYPSILAGISRAIRLSSAAPDWQSSFVCDISGPFMVSWVLRVLGESKRMGIKRLYFCARDVHSEFLIAKSLQCHFPDIDIKYLIISSSALYKSNLIWEYLQNMGFASDTPAAIVDSCTRGKTLYAINELLATHGYNPINGFFISHVGTPVTA